MPWKKCIDLVAIPDVRLTSFPNFVEGMIRQRPYLAASLVPHDPYVSTKYLQFDLGLAPALCVDLLQSTLRYYGVPSYPLIEYRVARNDHSILELYQLTWGAANIFDPGSFKPYRPPVSNLVC